MIRSNQNKEQDYAYLKINKKSIAFPFNFVRNRKWNCVNNSLLGMVYAITIKNTQRYDSCPCFRYSLIND